MTNTDLNSPDHVSEPGQSDWGLVVMLVTLVVATAILLILATP